MVEQHWNNELTGHLKQVTHHVVRLTHNHIIITMHRAAEARQRLKSIKAAYIRDKVRCEALKL